MCGRCDYCVPLRPRQLRIPRNVVVGRPEFVLKSGEPLEVMSDREFFGHAHPAVQLHRLLADESGGTPDRRLVADTARARMSGVASRLSTAR